MRATKCNSVTGRVREGTSQNDFRLGRDVPQIRFLADMPSDVFVVETTLQLLNAVEARAFFQSPSNHLILLLSEPFPFTAFEPLIAIQDWDSVRSMVIRSPDPKMPFLDSSGRLSNKLLEYYRYFLQFRRRSRLNRFARSFPEIQNLFLGNYLQEYMRHFARRASHRNLVLLDDGTDTIRINSNRKQSSPRSEMGGVVGRAKRGLHRYLHEWDAKHTDSVTFFSSYALETKAEDRLIRHEYSFYRNFLCQASRSEAIYFLGQPLVEDGYVSSETYTSLLENIRTRFSDSRFLYVPHKRESRAAVESLRDRLGLELMYPKLCIEYHIIQDRTLPKAVASFFCSALDNCRLIFGEEISVVSFYLGPELLVCGHDFVEDIYRYLKTQERRGFAVVPLKL
jgi:hypothetical protein